MTSFFSFHLLATTADVHTHVLTHTSTYPLCYMDCICISLFSMFVSSISLELIICFTHISFSLCKLSRRYHKSTLLLVCVLVHLWQCCLTLTSSPQESRYYIASKYTFLLIFTFNCHWMFALLLERLLLLFLPPPTFFLAYYVHISCHFFSPREWHCPLLRICARSSHQMQLTL